MHMLNDEHGAALAFLGKIAGDRARCLMDLPLDAVLECVGGATIARLGPFDGQESLMDNLAFFASFVKERPEIKVTVILADDAAMIEMRGPNFYHQFFFGSGDVRGLLLSERHVMTADNFSPAGRLH